VDIGSDQVTSQGRVLDSAPPQPPRQGRSMMAMATDNTSGDGGGMDLSNPAIAVMAQWGQTRQHLLKLASLLPMLSSGIQQMISGFEAVIPQQVADIVSGNPAGSSGSGLGGASAGAPTPPPVQTGMP
jgi:hypothetical protein